MYWSALMANITLSIRSLLAVIRAGGNESYPFTAGGYEFLESKVFRRESSPKGTPHAVNGRRKFSITSSATLPGQGQGLAAEPGATVPIPVWRGRQGVCGLSD
jgi:hypothetical protein